MKKCLFLLIFICFLFNGCSSFLQGKCTRKISEYRSCLFYFKGENFIATFTSGKREKDFLYNGIKTRLVPFGVISIKYLSNFDIKESRDYMLLIDSRQYNGKLEYNPIDGTFVADICKEVTKDSDIYLRIWGGGTNDQAEMVCISKDWVSYKSAFKEVVNYKKTDIRQFIID